MIGLPVRASVPATEWIRVTSSASSRVSGGRIPGRRRPSIVLPVPGGPARSTLCSPAAAISSARRPDPAPHLGEVGEERLLELVAARRGGERDALLAAEIGDRFARGGGPGMASIPASAASEADSAAQRRSFRPARRAPSATAIVPATGRIAAVERELADAGVLEQTRRRELMRAGEEREGDRKVEARSLLAQRRGREVDRDPVPRGPRQHRVDDAAAHPVLGLLARPIGEPDDRERRQVGRDEVRLDLDPPRLEADDGRGDGACEHPSDATSNPCRVCAELCRPRTRRRGSSKTDALSELRRRGSTRSTRPRDARYDDSRGARAGRRVAGPPAAGSRDRGRDGR